jgi:TolB-like protein/Tfp pilus assembly protein PilF
MANHLAELQDRSGESPPDERLDSWKEIAVYLKHSERTVRRWQEEGLPVHRHAHKKRAGVYAYKPELDAWWNDGRARLEALERGQTVQQRNGALWLAAASAALVLLAVGAYVTRDRIWPHPRPPAGKIMLAVLPFANLSDDPQQEYFSDGLTEEMISRLGQMEPQRLGIIARTSAIQYKGTKKRVDEIGKELGVYYILEGTVRRAGDRVRVSAQLIQVSDQTHLWAKNYERDVRDILNLQEEVAQAIASEVEIKLTPERQARLENVGQVNAAAYEAYLKGRYYLPENSRPALLKALDYFQHAILLDPNYALGYAGLAETYTAMNTGYMAPLEAGPKAKAAVLKALELDESLPLAHASLGKVHLYYDWDWPGAEKEFQRSLELNPNLPEAHLGYADYLASIGRFDESIEHAHLAFALDPLSVHARFQAIAHPFTVSRRYEKVLEECRKVRELPPDFTEPFADEAFAWARLGRFQEATQAAAIAVRNNRNPLEIAKAAVVYVESGKKEEARRLLQGLLAAAQKQFVCGYNVATVYASLGEKEQAFNWLEEGIKQRTL